ncbi:MAG: methyltransferase domain-containing protein [Deltaproteobacteria bacterium]|nr:methyltransferase domain-containing protein [Deltaproteobacteria bacterium]
MKEDGYYSLVREELLPLIPETAMKILDVGCGEGMLGEYLLQRGAQTVIGVEKDPEAAQSARSRLTRVIEEDVEALSFASDLGHFDAIICADVLEHLIDPWGVLKRISQCISHDGHLIASIPNTRYLALVNHLVNGHWTYDSSGLLDRTHLRFFTLSEIKEMFLKAGLSITALHGNLGPLYSEFKDRPDKWEICFDRLHIKGLSIEEFNEFFVFQYLVQAQTI